jgi:tetratricopeptide (TPR) repeat protein
MSRNRLNKKRNSLPGNTPPPGERHHPWWQWAIIIACLIGFTVVGWTLLSEDREKARALQLLRQGHFKEAEPLLKQVLERSPDDVQALQAMALGLHQSGAHPAEVETYVSRWCELEPTQVEPYLLSMHVNRELKRTREAVDDALHVLRLQPDNVEVRKKAASLLVASGQPSEAKKQCAECLKQKPNDPDVLLLLARIASLQGDHQQAEKQVDVVLRAQPDNTNAILQKALCLQERKEYHEAIPLLERVLSLNPDRTMARIAGYQLSQA